MIRTKLGNAFVLNIGAYLLSLRLDVTCARRVYGGSSRFRHIPWLEQKKTFYNIELADWARSSCLFGGETYLPVVIVETWSGKSEEQKATLIKGITGAFEDIGVTADQVHIIIHDVPKTNWGIRGEQASKLPP